MSDVMKTLIDAQSLHARLDESYCQEWCLPV